MVGTKKTSPRHTKNKNAKPRTGTTGAKQAQDVERSAKMRCSSVHALKAKKLFFLHLCPKSSYRKKNAERLTEPSTVPDSIFLFRFSSVPFFSFPVEKKRHENF